MHDYQISVNQDVHDWLTKRCISENCTIEDFISIIVNAVAVNSILNSKTNTNETQPQAV